VLVMASGFSQEITSYFADFSENPVVLEAVLRGFGIPFIFGGIFGISDIYGMKKKVNKLAQES